MTLHDAGRLTPFRDGIWTFAQPDHRMLGVKFGARMTVVRMPDRSLLVHSPVALSPALKAQIDTLGEVAHIVAPNLFHHVYAGPALAAWPRAILHAPHGLERKRPDLRIDRFLDEEETTAELGGALEAVPIEGSRLGETALVHPATRTLIAADLFENFREMDDPLTRLYLRAQGLWQKPGWGRALRFFYHDRRATRRSVDHLLEHRFEGAIVAHGEPVDTGATAIVRDTFGFLGPPLREPLLTLP